MNAAFLSVFIIAMVYGSAAEPYASRASNVSAHELKEIRTSVQNPRTATRAINYARAPPRSVTNVREETQWDKKKDCCACCDPCCPKVLRAKIVPASLAIFMIIRTIVTLIWAVTKRKKMTTFIILI